MTAHVIRHFDALDYVDRSRALGVDENVAKYQARQMEQLLDMATENARTAIEAKELATKKDLMEVKFDIIIWVAGLVAGLFVASGLIEHFFK